MKIGIFTQPLHTNYGGLLQNFALQKTLKNQGHEVWTINLPFRKNQFRSKKGMIKSFIKKYILGRKNIKVVRLQPSPEQRKLIRQHTDRFLKENIAQTDIVPTTKDIKLIEKYNFDAFVVGSDQVWRPMYSPGIQTFFFDFLKNDPKTKRIAYAASFGVDHWEYSPSDSKACRELASQMGAISVREDSGIKLCSDYLGVKAQQVLDPTLLLPKEDYEELVKKDGIRKRKNSLMAYVLDTAPDKQAVVTKVAQKLNLEINMVMPKPFDKEYNENISPCIYPPVTEWIAGFMNADFVVTDSFHGTAFSIIFNKPFISIGNKGRGISRFTSILKLLKLEDRLILDASELTDELIDSKINYKKVNEILDAERNKAFKFLKNNLEN